MTPARLRECRTALDCFVCPSCKQAKPFVGFYRNKANGSGRSSHCIECTKAYQTTPRFLALRRERMGASETKARQSAYRSRPDILARRRQARIMHWSRIILNEIRYRCRKRGLDFDINEDDLRVPECCPVLGIALSISTGNKTDGMATVDRRDPTKGYVRGNIEVMSWLANRIKSDCADPEVFEKIARWMRDAK